VYDEEKPLASAATAAAAAVGLLDARFTNVVAVSHTVDSRLL